jgi:PKHD-type hydroxylase
MLYQVIKGAFGQDLVAEVERRASKLQAYSGATVEHDEANTRQCELRWFRHGEDDFAWLEKEVFKFLEQAGAVDPMASVMEDIQHTVYGPGNFHDWHIDAYRRPYNLYDLPLGNRFIGTKRKVSLSILLNDASEFEGGTFEITMFPNGRNTVGTAMTDFSQAGDAAVFDSSLCHRVAPVTSGVRRSLVVWICG